MAGHDPDSNFTFNPTFSFSAPNPTGVGDVEDPAAHDVLDGADVSVECSEPPCGPSDGLGHSDSVARPHEVDHRGQADLARRTTGESPQHRKDVQGDLDSGSKRSHDAPDGPDCAAEDLPNLLHHVDSAPKRRRVAEGNTDRVADRTAHHTRLLENTTDRLCQSACGSGSSHEEVQLNDPSVARGPPADVQTQAATSVLGADLAGRFERDEEDAVGTAAARGPPADVQTQAAMPAGSEDLAGRPERDEEDAVGTAVAREPRTNVQNRAETSVPGADLARRLQRDEEDAVDFAQNMATGAGPGENCEDGQDIEGRTTDVAKRAGDAQKLAEGSLKSAQPAGMLRL